MAIKKDIKMLCQHHSEYKQYHPDNKSYCLGSTIDLCKNKAKWFYKVAHGNNVYICGMHRYHYDKQAKKNKLELCLKILT